MKMVLLCALVVVAGMSSPVQSGCTATLSKVTGHPLIAALVSALGTVTVALVGSLVLGQLGLAGKGAQVPWWAWLGGLAGSVFLVAQPVAADKLGAGPFIAVTVTASTVASIVIDHYGWLGFSQHSASWLRIAGAGAMAVGVGLVAAG